MVGLRIERGWGVVQNHDANPDGGLGELAFALWAAIECRATFQLVIFVFCLAVADSCVCIYCYADKRRKPQDCKQDIENGEGVWIGEALRSLKCGYRCLVDEDWYTEPALRTISSGKVNGAWALTSAKKYFVRLSLGPSFTRIAMVNAQPRKMTSPWSPWRAFLPLCR
jgi:hypothetical protein